MKFFLLSACVALLSVTGFAQRSAEFGGNTKQRSRTDVNQSVQAANIKHQGGTNQALNSHSRVYPVVQNWEGGRGGYHVRSNGPVPKEHPASVIWSDDFSNPSTWNIAHASGTI